MEDWPNVHEAADVPVGSIVRVLKRFTDEIECVGTVREKLGDPYGHAGFLACELRIQTEGRLEVYGRSHRFELIVWKTLSEEEQRQAQVPAGNEGIQENESG